MQFLEQIRKKTSLTDIINKLELCKNRTEKHLLQNKKIKDLLIILKNALMAKKSTQKPFSWTLLFYNAAFLLNLTHKTLAYNKNHEIIVKINDPNSARILQIQILEEITQYIDDQLKRQNTIQICIYTAEVLKSSNIKI